MKRSRSYIFIVLTFILFTLIFIEVESGRHRSRKKQGSKDETQESDSFRDPLRKIRKFTQKHIRPKHKHRGHGRPSGTEAQSNSKESRKRKNKHKSSPQSENDEIAENHRPFKNSKTKHNLIPSIKASQHDSIPKIKAIQHDAIPIPNIKASQHDAIPIPNIKASQHDAILIPNIKASQHDSIPSIKALEKASGAMKRVKHKKRQRTTTCSSVFECDITPEVPLKDDEFVDDGQHFIANTPPSAFSTFEAIATTQRSRQIESQNRSPISFPSFDVTDKFDNNFFGQSFQNKIPELFGSEDSKPTAPIDKKQNTAVTSFSNEHPDRELTKEVSNKKMLIPAQAKTEAPIQTPIPVITLPSRFQQEHPAEDKIKSENSTPAKPSELNEGTTPLESIGGLTQFINKQIRLKEPLKLNSIAPQLATAQPVATHISDPAQTQAPTLAPTQTAQAQTKSPAQASSQASVPVPAQTKFPAPASAQASFPVPAQTKSPTPASAQASVPVPAQTKSPAPASAQASAPVPAQMQAPAPAQGKVSAPIEGPAPIKAPAPIKFKASPSAPIQFKASPSAPIQLLTPMQPLNPIQTKAPVPTPIQSKAPALAPTQTKAFDPASIKAKAPALIQPKAPSVTEIQAKAPNPASLQAQAPNPAAIKGKAKPPAPVPTQDKTPVQADVKAPTQASAETPSQAKFLKQTYSSFEQDSAEQNSNYTTIAKPDKNSKESLGEITQYIGKQIPLQEPWKLNPFTS